MGESSLCYKSFQLHENINRELNIGYSHSALPFIIIPSLSILLNGGVIASKFIKKKKTSREDASMDKMLYILTFIELLISVYWLLTGTIFYNIKTMENHCLGCFFNSVFSVFIHSLDWMFFTCTLHNLKTILNNPLDGILKFKMRLHYYIIGCLGLSGMITLLAFMAQLYGISPHLTCFLRNDYHINKETDISATVSISLFLGIPVFFLFYGCYLCVAMFRNREARSNPNYKALIRKYISLGAIYLIFYFPTILLFYLTINKEIEENTFYSWLSYITAIANISIDFALCSIRIFFGHVNVSCLRIINFNSNLKEDLLNDFSTEQEKNRAISFRNLESQIMENFLRDIFIGICHTLTINKEFSIENMKVRKKDCSDKQRFMIRKNHIKFEDDIVKKLDNIYIDFTSYGPHVFRKLMQIEGINEDELIESLKPSKNNVSINQSQGKSGNFFICTDDNNLILKTIRDDELDLINKLFLKRYYYYLSNNQNSLICRIYGLFKISLVEKDVHVILMRNCIGKFKKNILCKYDLKGSTLNREIEVDMENIQKIVMKDNNFEEIEKCLLLDESDIVRLNKIVREDATFLKDLDIMDYSLLVVKISLNQKECEKIFGKSIHESIDQSISINEIDIDLDLNESEIKNLQKYLFRSLNRNVVYIIAIIDYFQLYNFFKFLETNIKYYIKNRPEKVTAISCVPSDIYCKRFIDYVSRITKVKIEEIQLNSKEESLNTKNDL